MIIASTNVNWFLPNCFSKHQTALLQKLDMVRKGFGNEPLKDLTMERKKVKEFDEFLR